MVVGLGAWCDYEDEHRDDGGLSFRVRELAAQPDSLFELDEGLTMIIGANRTAILFEVGVVHGVLRR